MAVNVWKFNSAGTEQWSASTGDTARGMTVDNDGNVYVFGIRNNNKSIWKFDSSGNEVDSYDTGHNTLNGCIDKDGHIWVVGGVVNNKAVWKFDSNLDLLLDINVDGSAYSIDSRDDHIYIGTASQGSPKYNVRKHTTNGENVWKYFVHPPLYPLIRDIRVKNYVYAAAGPSYGGIALLTRQGSYITTVAGIDGYYTVDVVPHSAIAVDDTTMKYQQITEEGIKKHQHIPGIVIGGGVRIGELGGVQMYNPTLTYRYGHCDLFNTFNVWSVTAGHDNTYMVVGIGRSYGITSTLYVVNICLDCAGQKCTSRWSKKLGDDYTNYIMYGTAVDPFGNIYCCGMEQT